MPRVINAATQTEYNKTVVDIGYLVQFTMSQIVRWCTYDTVNYAGVPWIQFDFKVEGLRFDPEREPEATLRAQNLDNAVSGLFQNEAIADAAVDIYEVVPLALAAGDAPKLARLYVNGCEITRTEIILKLVSARSAFAVAPRRRIDPSEGFSYAIAPGSQIPWGNEILIAEEDMNG